MNDLLSSNSCKCNGDKSPDFDFSKRNHMIHDLQELFNEHEKWTKVIPGHGNYFRIKKTLRHRYLKRSYSVLNTSLNLILINKTLTIKFACDLTQLNGSTKLKMKFSIKDLFSKYFQQLLADLVTFTEEILNRNLQCRQKKQTKQQQQQQQQQQLLSLS